MRRMNKKPLCAVLVTALLLSGVTAPNKAEAKAKVKISKTKLTMTVGTKKTLKIKGTKKKVKWSSSKTKVATVSKKGVVKAKKKGTAKITAKVGKKKYTCKVTVKNKPTKKTPTPAVKQTATPQASSQAGSSTEAPDNTQNPNQTGKPTGTPNPSSTSAQSSPTPTPEPDKTFTPSENDGEKTPAEITLSNGKSSWDYYHVSLGQVTVDAGATVTIAYTGISDGSLDYTNTHGTQIPMEVLVASEQYAPETDGSFWQNHCSNDAVIPLDVNATNTIYVRLKDNDTGKVYYLNSDNIIVRAKVEPTAAPTPTPTPTSNATTAPTPTPTPGGSTGGSVDLQGKTVFKVNSYELALGLTKAEVNTVLGSLTTDVKREEKSPQGFDVIAFRPNGNVTGDIDERFRTYILLYLKENKVVGITAIAPNVSYGDVISVGKTPTELGDGWNRADWYDTTSGPAGAYTKEVNGANIIGFADYYGDNTIYGIQVFSSDYSVDDMTDASKTNLTLNYSDEVLSAMTTEIGELLNAYLVACTPEKGAMGINSKLSGVAAAYSKEIADDGGTDANMCERSASEVKQAIKNAGINFNASWGERILIGNMDAVGFANSVIESENARVTLRSGDYNIMGLGVNACHDGSFYYPNLVIDFIDYIAAM